MNEQVNIKIKLKSKLDVDEMVNNLTTLMKSSVWTATKPVQTPNSYSNSHLVPKQILSLIVEKRSQGKILPVFPASLS